MHFVVVGYADVNECEFSKACLQEVMGMNSLYYFLYGRVCYQTSKLSFFSKGGIESNLRKLFILSLSSLTFLFVFAAKSLNRNDGQIIGFLR